MTDAPERIWLDWPAANKGDPVYDEPPERDTQPGQTEYIRADAARAEAEAMVRAEREACAQAMAALSAELSAAGRTEASGAAILAIERIRARGE